MAAINETCLSIHAAEKIETESLGSGKNSNDETINCLEAHHHDGYTKRVIGKKFLREKKTMNTERIRREISIVSYGRTKTLCDMVGTKRLCTERKIDRRPSSEIIG